MASQVHNFSLSEMNWQKNQPQHLHPMSEPDHIKDSVESNVFEDFAEPKTWNLRPRKPLKKLSNGNHGERQETKVEIRQQMDTDTKTPEAKKEKKQKFLPFLTREEIENDISIMTGGRPSRRPRKRAKTVQKQIDNLLPGLWLSSVTPDCYKVPDPPIKG